MFLDNKYTKWYNQLILTRKSRSLEPDTYTEKHHIIPKSIGGSNDNDNLIILTAREHFIAHWLLAKMCEGQYKAKMYYAFFAMSFDKGKSHRKYSSKYYELSKKYLVEANKIREPHSGYKWKDTSNLSKAKMGNKNMLGKKHSEASKALMSSIHSGKTLSNETKMKMSTSKIGVKKSDETRSKMSLAQSTLTASCPHCSKIGNYRAMKRWHFNNCKSLQH